MRFRRNLISAALRAALFFPLALPTSAHADPAGGAGITRYVDGQGARFESLAGSKDNLTSLATGLRTGSEVTLVEQTPTGPRTTTFTPATGHMGYGNVTRSLDFARRDLASYGIKDPTAADLKAALNGGTVTTSKGDVHLDGVLQLRSEGLGWGKIAHTIGISPGERGKLHHVVWHHGDWHHGDWRNAEWRDGNWRHGEWRHSDWRHSDWRNSDWRNSNWRNGEWRNGNDSRSGAWRSSDWRNGEWRNGSDGRGEWRNGDNSRHSAIATVRGQAPASGRGEISAGSRIATAAGQGAASGRAADSARSRIVTAAGQSAGAGSGEGAGRGRIVTAAGAGRATVSNRGEGSGRTGIVTAAGGSPNGAPNSGSAHSHGNALTTAGGPSGAGIQTAMGPRAGSARVYARAGK